MNGWMMWRWMNGWWEDGWMINLQHVIKLTTTVNSSWSENACVAKYVSCQSNAVCNYYHNKYTNTLFIFSIQAFKHSVHCCFHPNSRQQWSVFFLAMLFLRTGFPLGKAIVLMDRRCVAMPGKVSSGDWSGNTLPADCLKCRCLSVGGGTAVESACRAACSGHTWGCSSELCCGEREPSSSFLPLAAALLRHRWVQSVAFRVEVGWSLAQPDFLFTLRRKGDWRWVEHLL